MKRLPTMFRATLAAALLASTVVAGAHAQGVDGAAGPAAPATGKPAPTSFVSLIGPTASTMVPTFLLPAPDVAALKAEDAARSATGDKSLRTGVSRDLRVKFADGRWDAVPGVGWLWRVEVGSKDASGVRLHLTGMSLPDGAKVQFLRADGVTVAAGPFTGRGTTNDGDMWTPVVPGDRAVVECLVPGDPQGPAPAIEPFQVDLVMHNYRDPFDPALGDIAPLEGSCHNDVSCYSGWLSLSHAVARIDYVDGGVGHICTGQLLNSLAGDLQPYFLTANHCISTAAAAASATIYWDYQTPSCGGAVPGLGTVPSSAVCQLLSNNATSDYSFLMVLGTLPNGRYWSGWQAGDPTDGTLVTGIHHPTGAYKRISFGTKVAGAPANHVRASWYSGVTEPGSSGSGLFRQDNQRLVGQLHGGASVCGGSDLTDDYGSFQVTYPNISGWLAAGPDDGFENNDACASATAVGNGSWGGLVVRYGHDDWYSIFVPANQRVVVDLGFTYAYGDIDVTMSQGCGGALLASSTGTSDSEHLDWYNTTGAAQTVKVHVYLYSNTRNAYNLSVFVGAFPNLSATSTPSGFTYPSVPRRTGDAGLFNAPLPATLDGNITNTYVNWAILNAGPGTTPEAWESDLFVDDAFYASFGIGPNNPGAFSWQALNVGPTTIPGGRHSFTSYADYLNQVLESTKADNVWTGQWVWSPLVRPSSSGLFRYPPPARGALALPNSDGFQFSRPGSYAWVTGVAPTLAGDDYDLYVYGDYSGSLSGFSSLVGSSAFGGTYTDFVVGHYSGTPTTVYPAAVRYLAGTGSSCVVDQSDASGRNGSGSGATWIGQLMQAGRLVDVYEANLTAGTLYRFALNRTAGTSALHCELFDGTPGTIRSRGYGLGTSFATDATHDVLSYTPTVSGWHPLVVYRDNGVGAGTDVEYTLSWGSGAFVDAPGGGTPRYALDFAGAQPNPIRTEGRVAFTLPQASHVKLALYDVTGRVVSTLADREFAAGPHDVTWPGRSDAGRALGAGVYWARLDVAGRSLTRRVVVMP